MVDPALPGADVPLERPGGPTGVRIAPPRAGDRVWMARALEQARLAALAGEVPVGAVLVRTPHPDPSGGPDPGIGEACLVAEGHNRTLTRPDPTAHAEVEVLRAAAARSGSWHLGGHTLYVTLEPCAQCAGALVLARVDRVVYGAPDPKTGMAGSLGNLLQDPRLNHRVSLTRGVLGEVCGAFLREFFRARRGASVARASASGTPSSGPTASGTSSSRPSAAVPSSPVPTPPRSSAHRTLSMGLALLLAGGCTLATSEPPPPPPPADLPAPTWERPAPSDPANAGRDPGRADPGPPGTPAAPPPAVIPPERSPGATPGAPATTSTPAPGAAGGLVLDAGAFGVTGVALGPRPFPATLPRQVRALWVVRTSLVHPDSVRAVVRRAEAAGFNTLLVQVRGRGDAWYASSLEPRALQLAHLPESFDPLGLLLEEATPRGIQVHAWLNVHVVASTELPPLDPRHLLHAHPEWLALPRALVGEVGHLSPHDPRYRDALVRWTRANADQVEGLYTSPAHPGVRDRVVQVVEELLERYPVAGIHLDYVRYPSPHFDYSREALAGFRRWLVEGRGELLGVTPAAVTQLRGEGEGGSGDAALADAFPQAWAAFREEQVTTLVARVAASVRTRAPGAILTAAVFPELSDARSARFQRWDAWLASGWIDAVVPMSYTDRDEVHAAQLRAAAQFGGPGRVWAGIGVYRNSFAGAVAKGRNSLAAGAGGVVLFSYDWTVGPEGQAAARPFGGGGIRGDALYLDRWARELWPGAALPP